METLSAGVVRTATPGVETIVSALPYLTPAQWALAASGVLFVGAATVAAAHRRGPREEFTDRARREAAQARAQWDRGGVDLAMVRDTALWMLAIAALAVFLVSDSPVVHWTGAALAVACSVATVLVDWRTAS
ncbi:hypothetical protein GCM10023224_04670 [Streptomonospora halophila]|uniref:SdpI/YhfL protein family protein n=1 Tax=Streptomonospora halophila TaxID=427369 RepID=A0ABP9G5U1_9ACTN